LSIVRFYWFCSKADREKIYELKAAGKTNREIAGILGFADKWIVKGIGVYI